MQNNQWNQTKKYKTNTFYITLDRIRNNKNWQKWALKILTIILTNINMFNTVLDIALNDTK